MPQELATVPKHKQNDAGGSPLKQALRRYDMPRAESHAYVLVHSPWTDRRVSSHAAICDEDDPTRDISP